MAYECPYSVLIQSLLLIAIASIVTSSTRYHIIDGSKMSRFTIHGRLVCSATGNHVSGTDSLGLAGVEAVLKCGSGKNKVILVKALTNITGIFKGFLDNNVEGANLHLDPSSSCIINVKLPIKSCDLLPNIGNLQAPLNLVKVVQSVVGRVIVVYEAGLFEFVF